MTKPIHSTTSPLTPPPPGDWTIDKTVRTFTGTVTTRIEAVRKTAYLQLAKPMMVEGFRITEIQLGRTFNGFDGRTGSLDGYLRRPQVDAASRPTDGRVILSAPDNVRFQPVPH